jgi:hypothetical protein
MLWKVVLFLDGFPGHLEDLEGKPGNILILVHKVPGEGLPDLEEADIQEVLNKHAAQLSEQITVFSEPEVEDLYAVVENPQLTANAVKKCLQLVDVLVHCVFEVDHFMNKCLKCMHKMEAVIALRMAMCEDLRKPAKQSKVTSFSLLSLPSPRTLSFSPSHNFQPETHTSFQETPTHIFVPSGHLHIIRFRVLWYL